MKINKDIVDISHETIQEETNESIIVSIKNTDDDEDFIVRFHLNYHEETSVLVAGCVDEMNKNEQVRDFFMKVQDQYFDQF
tara:strand:- start:3732 stop:3974 length:243 start_codon:yes stop_codon:yes gene_type:complete